MLLVKVKNRINDTISKYLNIITKKRRVRYIDKKIKKLENTRVSIISNDCTGGVVCHDLGLKFLSPTINLFFYHNDYIEYLENLIYYNNAEIFEISKTDVEYPVGEIVRNENKINICFMHYDNFETEKQKWNERSKRVVRCV